MRDRNAPFIPSWGGALTLYEGADIARRMERSGYNFLPGGGLHPGQPRSAAWPVRVTGTPSGGAPGLYPGVILRLAYQPARSTGDGGPVAWYAPDRPPLPAFKRTPAGDPAGRPLNPPEPDYGFYTGTNPYRPLPDLPDVLLVPGPGQTLEVDQTGAGQLVGEWDGKPILMVAATGGGSGGVARLRLVGTAPGTAGAFAVARRTTRSGGAWAGAGGDTPVSTDVWLVEPNGGVLPDRTAGRAYIALDTGVSEAVSGTTRRLWVAIVPPGVLTNAACLEDGNFSRTWTPVGVS